MKIPRITNSISHIDDDIVAEAIDYKKRKNNSWIKYVTVAACLVIVIVSAAVFVPMMFESDGPIESGTDEESKTKHTDIADRDYSGILIDGEAGIDFPWEYKLIYEKFPVVQYEGKKYVTRARSINKELLGEFLGTCTADGVSYYENNKLYEETFDVRRIKGVSDGMLVAIGANEDYYVYFNEKSEQPATFGELLDLYNLEQTLPLAKFSVNEGYKEKEYYRIADDAYIWQVLSECRDAKSEIEKDGWNRGDGNYLSFTATSEELGVYKRVLYISEDGYISTNVFDYQYVYFIGEEKANSIITYAKSNATEAKREQYEYTIAGTLTEIGDGYILVDDTVLCKDKTDGVVFKILTEDLQIRRYIECCNFKVGDTVAVKFQNKIVSRDNTVGGAVSMYKGIVTDNGLAVLE